MKRFKPKDEELLMWDPENMDKYWEQCETFDHYSLNDKVLNSQEFAEQQSQQTFQVMMLSYVIK